MTVKKSKYIKAKNFFDSNNKYNEKDDFYYFSVFPEKDCIENLLRILSFHPNKIDEIKKIIDVRDHCAHASGFIQYDVRSVIESMSKEEEFVDTILSKTNPIIIESFYYSITNLWSLNDFKNTMTSQFVIDYIKDNLLSNVNIEYLLENIISKFNNYIESNKSDLTNSCKVSSYIIKLAFSRILDEYFTIKNVNSYSIELLRDELHGIYESIDLKEQDSIRIEIYDELSILKNILNDELLNVIQIDYESD